MRIKKSDTTFITWSRIITLCSTLKDDKLIFRENLLGDFILSTTANKKKYHTCIFVLKSFYCIYLLIMCVYNLIHDTSKSFSNY